MERPAVCASSQEQPQGELAIGLVPTQAAWCVMGDVRSVMSDVCDPCNQVRVAIGEQEYRLYEDWRMILGINYLDGTCACQLLCNPAPTACLCFRSSDGHCAT
jgi:hypothetical protein